MKFNLIKKKKKEKKKRHRKSVGDESVQFNHCSNQKR